MPILFRHIRTRITVVFLLLLSVVLGAVLFAVYRASLANAQAQVEAEFDTAGRSFVRLMQQRAAFLRQGAEVLAADSAFRQALQGADLANVEAVLGGQARRLKADMAMLVSLEGRLLVNTRFPNTFGEAFPCPRMLQLARSAGGAAGYVRIEGQAYQVVLTPVRAPQPVAWLALGFPVNDASAAEFRALTGVGVSFISVGDDGAHMLASSLAGELRERASAWLSGFVADDYHTRRATLDGEEYWARFVKLESASALDYVAVLTFSLDAAMAPYQRLRGTLLTISLLALAAFLYGASLLAKRLTLPIQELADALRRVGRGRYDTRVYLKNQDELGELASGFNHMAGEIAAREKQITYLAYHDALTGLPNRMSFVNALNAEIAARKLGPGVMMVACLERLRAISVNLGFVVADGLAAGVAQRIQARDDWRVASLGGEKFAFFCPLMPGMDRDEWEVRVRAVLEVPMEWQGQLYDLGMHLGSALYPQDGSDAATLLRRAEQAMQHGVRSAGAHVAFQPGFDALGARRLALLNDLRGGIEAGDLFACYQPKARLTDGRVVACEMLARWRHPQHGVVMPDEFIPAAEQSTLIRPLTNWVIDTAAEQAARWREAGREMAVGVNLSARNLADHEVVDRIATALARHALPPAALIVEITESALMDDPEMAVSVVNAIAALGVKVSIDDFGTGYSSLSQLTRLPVREVKIDKTFVLRMLESGQDAAIVKSTIDLAHTLGLEVVAEGVETVEHWQRLLAYGCDVAQGYYLSRPAEAPAFEAWLLEREA
ncbi:MAG: EAL domain-containing protein [Pseudomonadota bacterium]